VGPNARIFALLRRFASTSIRRRLTLKLCEKLGFWRSEPSNARLAVGQSQNPIKPM
jgi:hypothetical protein